MHPTDIGLTCCHGDDLREVGGPFYSRIDYVLLRNGFRAVAAGIVGQKPSDRISRPVAVGPRRRLGAAASPLEP